MAWMRAAVGLVALLAIGAALVSGGSGADSVRYRYLPEANALRTVSLHGTERVMTVRSLGDSDLVDSHPRWLAAARPLGAGAPGWARSMYERSLLVLRALTNRRTGAVLAGARDGWAYVWPRDAGAVSLAFRAAGYHGEAQRIARFLLGLDLRAAARYHGDGSPVKGREAQGDAAGWVAKAAGAWRLSRSYDGKVATRVQTRISKREWEGKADYQEGDAGDYLGNAIASGASLEEFVTPRGLVRAAGDLDSGLDSTAAWAVRPFPQPARFPIARRTLLRLSADSTRFGLLPSESWGGGEDPWTAPTAWSAWSLAALGERRAALRLMAALRRAATPQGLLPERVDIHTGTPTSTTPLAWSHAFAILALRELWP